MHTSRQLVHDTAAQRFRLPLDEGEAYVAYREKDGGTLHLIYAETPREQRGQGIGKELVEKTFDHIKAHELRAVAVCPFIRSVLRSSERWAEHIS